MGIVSSQSPSSAPGDTSQGCLKRPAPEDPEWEQVKPKPKRQCRVSLSSGCEKDQSASSLLLQYARLPGCLKRPAPEDPKWEKKERKPKRQRLSSPSECEKDQSASSPPQYAFPGCLKRPVPKDPRWEREGPRRKRQRLPSDFQKTQNGEHQEAQDLEHQSQKIRNHLYEHQSQNAQNHLHEHQSQNAQNYLHEHQSQKAQSYFYERKSQNAQSYFDEHQSQNTQNYLHENQSQNAQNHLYEHQSQNAQNYLHEHQSQNAQSYFYEHKSQNAQSYFYEHQSQNTQNYLHENQSQNAQNYFYQYQNQNDQNYLHEPLWCPFTNQFFDDMATIIGQIFPITQFATKYGCDTRDVLHALHAVVMNPLRNPQPWFEGMSVSEHSQILISNWRCPEENSREQAPSPEEPTGSHHSPILIDDESTSSSMHSISTDSSESLVEEVQMLDSDSFYHGPYQSKAWQTPAQSFRIPTVPQSSPSDSSGAEVNTVDSFDLAGRDHRPFKLKFRGTPGCIFQKKEFIPCGPSDSAESSAVEVEDLDSLDITGLNSSLLNLRPFRSGSPQSPAHFIEEEEATLSSPSGSSVVKVRSLDSLGATGLDYRCLDDRPLKPEVPQSLTQFLKKEKPTPSNPSGSSVVKAQSLDSLGATGISHKSFPLGIPPSLAQYIKKEDATPSNPSGSSVVKVQSLDSLGATGFDRNPFQPEIPMTLAQFLKKEEPTPSNPSGSSVVKVQCLDSLGATGFDHKPFQPGISQSPSQFIKKEETTPSSPSDSPLSSLSSMSPLSSLSSLSSYSSVLEFLDLDNPNPTGLDYEPIQPEDSQTTAQVTKREDSTPPTRSLPKKNVSTHSAPTTMEIDAPSEDKDTVQPRLKGAIVAKKSSLPETRRSITSISQPDSSLVGRTPCRKTAHGVWVPIHQWIEGRHQTAEDVRNANSQKEAPEVSSWVRDLLKTY